MLKNFTTKELIQWSKFQQLYEQDLCIGTLENPVTGVFNRNTDAGASRWDELKKRVVEHVSVLLEIHLLSCKKHTICKNHLHHPSPMPFLDFPTAPIRPPPQSMHAFCSFFLQKTF